MALLNCLRHSVSSRFYVPPVSSSSSLRKRDVIAQVIRKVRERECNLQMVGSVFESLQLREKIVRGHTAAGLEVDLGVLKLAVEATIPSPHTPTREPQGQCATTDTQRLRWGSAASALARTSSAAGTAALICTTDVHPWKSARLAEVSTALTEKAEMSERERQKSARRDDPERRRIEDSIAAQIAEGSTGGNITMIRLDQLRLAALRFAYEGTLEQHRRLAAFDINREQGPVSAMLVAKVVYADDTRPESLKELFGVSEPTDDEADFFVSNVTADAWALQHGEKPEP